MTLHVGTIVIGKPIAAGNRTIVAVIRIDCSLFSGGVAGVVDPAALVFAESGSWYLVPLAPGFGPGELERAVSGRNPGETDPAAERVTL